MKTGIIGLLLAGCLVLAGCSSTTEGSSDSSEQAASSSAAVSAESKAAAVNVIESSEGSAQGNETDCMRTKFFDFTANESSLTTDYKGIRPDPGKKLLCVSVTVHNTSDSEISMFDTDFQAQWGEDDSAAYAVPVTYETSLAADGMLETSYTLQADESITGDLVFEIPDTASQYTLCYEEVFEDGTTGDTFFVTLSPVSE